MLSSLAKAFGQLPDPRFRKVLTFGIVGTLVIYILVYIAIGWGMSRLALFGIGWADTLTDLLGGLAVMVLTLLMAPSIAMTVLSFLLEDILQAVEAVHYPGLPEPRRQGWLEIAWGALRFAAVIIAVNLLALPLYIVLLLLGIGPLLYFAVNGYLLSREYFELVSWRRLSPAQSDALRRAHLGRLWLLGGALAALSTIPGINLLVPVVGTAAMLHEFESLRRRAGLL